MVAASSEAPTAAPVPNDLETLRRLYRSMLEAAYVPSPERVVAAAMATLRD